MRGWEGTRFLGSDHSFCAFGGKRGVITPFGYYGTPAGYYANLRGFGGGVCGIKLLSYILVESYEGGVREMQKGGVTTPPPHPWLTIGYV